MRLCCEDDQGVVSERWLSKSMTMMMRRRRRKRRRKKKRKSMRKWKRWEKVAK